MGKVAYFVYGPESTGTRVVARAFIAAGCYGDGGHTQRIDSLSFEELKNLPDQIVFRRSLPHNHEWPDIKSIVDNLKDAGFEVVLVHTDRDTECTIKSQLLAPHVQSAAEAELNIAKAKTLQLNTAELGPVIHLPYEYVVVPGWLKARLAELGLELPNEFELYNANLKYRESIRKRRILYCTHAPWRNTGYGSTADAIAKGFKTLGHEVLFYVAGNGWPGVQLTPEYPIITPPPNMFEAVLGNVIADNEIDTLITNFDVWTMKQFKAQGDLQWFPWFPVDQYPLPANTAEAIEGNLFAVTYSTYGRRVLQTSMPNVMARQIHMPVLPAFFGITKSKADAKNLFGLPNGPRIIGVVGNLVDDNRKAVDEMIDAVALYMRDHDARLVMAVNDNGRLFHLCRETGIANKTWFVPPYIRELVLGAHVHIGVLYRAFDVLLHTSAAEGFGLCMAEAMATGTPVIATNTSSMPEVVGQGGILVDAPYSRRSPYGGIWHFPDHNDIYMALKEDLSGCKPKQQAYRWHLNHTISAWQALFEEADNVLA